MNSSFLKSISASNPLLRLRGGAVRRLLPGLLAVGLLARLPLALAAGPTPPTAPSVPAVVLPTTGAPTIQRAQAAPQHSPEPLIAALAQFLFVLGAVVVLLQLWRSPRDGQGAFYLALAGAFMVSLALAGRAVVEAVCRHWFILLAAGFLLLSAPVAFAGLSDPLGLAGSGIVLLGQAEPSLDPIMSFLSKVMMLVGGVMIFAGGWKIHRGETTEGLLAIAGGFIVAVAFPIIRFFFTHV